MGIRPFLSDLVTNLNILLSKLQMDISVFLVERLIISQLKVPWPRSHLKECNAFNYNHYHEAAEKDMENDQQNILLLFYQDNSW